MLNYNRTCFYKSAHTLDQLPADNGQEVALVGRSNAGKSCSLNAITGMQHLAKTSKTPGRTQLINFFQIQPHPFYLVDLPGYGYAKIPRQLKSHWQKTLDQYFANRQSLKGLLLINDIRHPLTPLDEQMLSWATYHGIPVHILLNKMDKLKRGAAQNTLLRIQKKLSDSYPLASVQLFSAIKKLGLAEAHAIISSWFDNNALSNLHNGNPQGTVKP